MNTDQLIEHLHSSNALRREAEHAAPRRRWRLVVPAAVAAAAVALVVLLPHGNKAQASPTNFGIYCNSDCNPSEVLALIDNNIDYIKQISAL